MAELTSNFGLTKPDPNDFYDVQVLNENLDKLDELATSCYAKLYGEAAEKNADDLTESLAVVYISSTVNPELYNALGGGAFAWVQTNFYKPNSVAEKKMQIAMSTDFIHQKMVFRTYGVNGWLPWREIATHTYGTEDLTPGESELSTGTLHFVYE